MSSHFLALIRERGDWLIETAKEWVEDVREDLLSEKGRE
jgi:hypothetical protein